MAGRAAAKDGDDSRCPGCRAPIHRGRWLGLLIVANTRPLNAAEQEQARRAGHPHHLVWCLRTSKWTPTRLAEIHRSSHRPDCPFPHVSEHLCPRQTSLM